MGLLEPVCHRKRLSYLALAWRYTYGFWDFTWGPVPKTPRGPKEFPQLSLGPGWRNPLAPIEHTEPRTLSTRRVIQIFTLDRSEKLDHQGAKPSRPSKFSQNFLGVHPRRAQEKSRG